MKSSEVEIKGKKVIGIEVPLPGAPLVLAYTKNGFVMCGYLNIETADKLKVAAGLVRGVDTFDDLLKAKIQGVSESASKRGVKVDMTGEEALARLI